MQFDLRTMAEHMGGVAWAVVIVLFIMSMYSIAVMIERFWTFKKATDQSRKYAPEVARLLKSGKHQARRSTPPHGAGSQVLATSPRCSGPGLQEWQYQQESGEVAKRQGQPRSTPRSARSSARPP